VPKTYHDCLAAGKTSNILVRVYIYGPSHCWQNAWRMNTSIMKEAEYQRKGFALVHKWNII